MSNFQPRITNPEDDDRNAWQNGFQPGSDSGMVCDICRCLVRQDPGSARIHLEWHEQLEAGTRGDS